MSRLTRWRVLWAVFLALLNGEPGDTISETVWELVELSWLLWAVLAAVMVWLTVHYLLPKVADWWMRAPWRRD